MPNDMCLMCDKYIKTGVESEYCPRWFHFKCENTTEEQASKEYPAEQQYIWDQHQNFKSALQAQYQKKTGEMKKQKEKYENAKEKLMEMGKIYNELKVNNWCKEKTGNSYKKK